MAKSNNRHWFFKMDNYSDQEKRLQRSRWELHALSVVLLLAYVVGLFSAPGLMLIYLFPVLHIALCLIYVNLDNRTAQQETSYSEKL
jgi:uncharacterized membrane protein